MRRVVITGCGCFVHTGDNIANAWNSIIEGQSWIDTIKSFDTTDYKCKVASQVLIDDAVVEKYKDLIPLKEKKRMDEMCYQSIIAAHNALEDCGLLNKDFNKDRCGTFIASGIGGIKSINDGVLSLKEKGPKRVSPFFLVASLANMSAGNVALKFGLKGASMCHVSACASSTHAIGEAFNYIRTGRLDSCLAGGTESAVCPIGVAGFDSMNALSTKYNEDPKHASRALDKGRDGFVMGEGSVVLMLEELEHAKARGAKIYCEIVGYGASCDAYHFVAPDSSGAGASKAMKYALEDAGLKSDDVDYINLHGTSTPAGDIAEITAIKNTFVENSKVAISSTKSITGHLLGATGALEAMICAKTIETQTIPGSINIENLDDACDGLNIVQKSTKADVKVALSNSFGFGGTNGCLVFKKFED